MNVSQLKRYPRPYIDTEELWEEPGISSFVDLVAHPVPEDTDSRSDDDNNQLE